MTLEEAARQRARDRQNSVVTSLAQLTFPTPKRLLTEIRAYLLRQMEEHRHLGINVEASVKERRTDHDVVVIDLGPTTIRGQGPRFELRSGATLAFGITLRDERQRSTLLSYRFDYRHPSSAVLPLLRFELAKTEHDDCLAEPRAHVHPGLNDLRLPTGPLGPLEVLDLLFFVVDPKMPR